MLWLLRHAEAVDGLPDDERPLTDRGIRQADAVGRALQTAQLACEPLGLTPTIEPALSGEPFDVQTLTAGLGDVLLVGHDPSFSLLLHDLTGAQARMRKGGLAGVAKGELVVLLRPTELSAIAGVQERVA